MSKHASEFRPAEAFPVASVIIDELRARNLTLDQLAVAMCENDVEFEVLRLVLDFSVSVNNDPDLLLGKGTAHRLEKALGISAEFWLRTDEIYRQWLRDGGTPWEATEDELAAVGFDADSAGGTQ